MNPLLRSQMLNLLRKLYCFVFGHDMYVWQELKPWSRRVCCDHCGGDWGMNDNVQAMIKWDDDLQSLYEWQGIKIRPRTAPKG